MKLTKEVLDQVLNLAHLELDENSKSGYLSQLQSVLDHMAQLNKLDLDQISPSSWSEGVSTPFREDKVVEQSLPSIEDNAPKWENNCFSVPKILGGES